MATGKFRLYYTHVDVQHPAAGVQYRLTNKETGQYFSFGVTDAHGETKNLSVNSKLRPEPQIAWQRAQAWQQTSAWILGL